MKAIITFLLLCATSNNVNAQTKQIANESSGMSDAYLLEHKDDFGEPSSDKIIDTIRVINDSTFLETYHWTYPNFHSGTDQGTDTVVIQNVQKSYFIYSKAFAANFDNKYSSEKKAVIIYSNKAKSKSKKANKIDYSKQISSFKYIKKSSSSLLFLIISLVGVLYFAYGKWQEIK
jgi:hypothetical protein